MRWSAIISKIWCVEGIKKEKHSDISSFYMPKFSNTGSLPAVGYRKAGIWKFMKWRGFEANNLEVVVNSHHFLVRNRHNGEGISYTSVLKLCAMVRRHQFLFCIAAAPFRYFNIFDITTRRNFPHSRVLGAGWAYLRLNEYVRYTYEVDFIFCFELCFVRQMTEVEICVLKLAVIDCYLLKNVLGFNSGIVNNSKTTQFKYTNTLTTLRAIYEYAHIKIKMIRSTLFPNNTS